jgi:PIN domain nuclease of toxin-antitoxin system
MSENYSKFINSDYITTKLNVFEVSFRILKESEEKAKIAISLMVDKTVDFDNTVILEACKFKLSNKSKNLSMTDCIGYTIALKAGIRFLTGDKEFKDLPNVEFVK